MTMRPEFTAEELEMIEEGLARLAFDDISSVEYRALWALTEKIEGLLNAED